MLRFLRRNRVWNAMLQTRRPSSGREFWALFLGCFGLHGRNPDEHALFVAKLRLALSHNLKITCQ